MHSSEKENLDLCKNPNKSYSSARDTPSYEYEKIFALRRLNATLKEQLKFLANIKHCQEYDLRKLEKISHNVFSWSREDFLARRQLDNCIWVDVLILKSSLKCLEKQKAVADLKEVQKFVDLIFKAACKGQHEGNIMEDMLWRPLRYY